MFNTTFRNCHTDSGHLIYSFTRKRFMNDFKSILNNTYFEGNEY